MIGVAVLDQCLLSYNETKINFHLVSWEVKALKPSAFQNSQHESHWEPREGCGHLHLVQKSLQKGSEV